MIYESPSYKVALERTLLQRREQVSKTFTFQNMAKACRVQKTYLSRVFRGDAHLNDDQVFLACDYLTLSSSEEKFVTLLHQYERSVVPKKKEVIRQRLETLRRENLATDKHISAPTVTASVNEHAEYYLNPMAQLAHMYLTVPKFAANRVELRKALGVDELEMAAIIKTLQKLGYIEFKEGKFVVTGEHVHLSPDSMLYKPYRQLLRLKAMEKCDKLSSTHSYNFSVIFSANDETFRRIQDQFLNFLKSIEADVKAAPPENVYQLGFDVFRWT